MISAKLIELMPNKNDIPSARIKDLFEFFTIVHSTQGGNNLRLASNMPYICTIERIFRARIAQQVFHLR